MITVYGLQSPYVYRVRACLLKKHLSFQHVSVNMGLRSEQFKKLSPVGTIPILEDEDGTVICDSLHIGLYLDEKYPNTYKMFGDLKTKMKILNIVGLVDRIHQLNHPFSSEKHGYAQRYRDNGMPHRAIIFDEDQKHSAQKDISARLERLNELIGGRPFFTGHFSFADAAMLCLVNSLQSGGTIQEGFWIEWKENTLKDQTIASMFTPKEEKGVREI